MTARKEERFHNEISRPLNADAALQGAIHSIELFRSLFRNFHGRWTWVPFVTLLNCHSFPSSHHHHPYLGLREDGPGRQRHRDPARLQVGHAVRQARRRRRSLGHGERCGVKGKLLQLKVSCYINVKFDRNMVGLGDQTCFKR